VTLLAFAGFTRWFSTRPCYKSTVGVEVHGHVEPRFAPVREAFATNFAAHGEVGAACSVYHRGRPVVDLWAGLEDPNGGRPWTADTTAVVFSATKGLTAVCVLRLVEQGRLDLDTPVAAYWPEFGAGGKSSITLGWVLSHRAGIPVVDAPLTLDEVLAWEPVVSAIAAQPPVWEPGTRHGYHFRTYGWILGEVIRRVTGKTPGRFFADEIAAPLGVDFWIGLPESEESRVATLVPPDPLADPDARALFEQMAGPTTLLGRAMTGPSDLFHYDEMWNRRALHAAEMPSSNGIGSARALARIYAAVAGTVGGVQLLAPATLAAASRVRSEGPDAVLMLPTRFGTGFMLPPTLCLGAPPSAFGHPGAGGSLGLGDPEAEIGFGYVMNRMQFGVTGDPRAAGLIAAVYAALG
jgi:CubicO group peptidase (beta-lactamase class C family)